MRATTELMAKFTIPAPQPVACNSPRPPFAGIRRAKKKRRPNQSVAAFQVVILNGGSIS